MDENKPVTDIVNGVGMVGADRNSIIDTSAIAVEENIEEDKEIEVVDSDKSDDEKQKTMNAKAGLMMASAMALQSGATRYRDPRTKCHKGQCLRTAEDWKKVNKRKKKNKAAKASRKQNRRK